MTPVCGRREQGRVQGLHRVLERAASARYARRGRARAGRHARHRRVRRVVAGRRGRRERGCRWPCCWPGSSRCATRSPRPISPRRYPESGAATSTAGERLGPAAGRLAGVAFLAGKSASAAAAAGVFGAYVLPVAAAAHRHRRDRGGHRAEHRRRALDGPRGVRAGRRHAGGAAGGGRGGAVRVRRDRGGVGGDRRVRAGGGARAGCSAWAPRPAWCSSPSPATPASPPWARRSATRSRTLPRAILIALGAALVTYLLVAVALLVGLGSRTAGRRVGAAGGAGRHRAGQRGRGAGPGRRRGGGRVGPAVGADRAQPDGAGHGPARRAAAGAGRGRRRAARRSGPTWPAGWSPCVIAVLAGPAAAIAVSACSVLVYYAVINLSALRLPPGQRHWPGWTAGLGLVGCAGAGRAAAVRPGRDHRRGAGRRLDRLHRAAAAVRAWPTWCAPSSW